MKALLDRLMARQARLMSQLDHAPRGVMPDKQSASVRMTSKDRSAQLAREEHALDAAADALSRGALDEVVALLEPQAGSALDVRTLTTLARVYGAQGRIDDGVHLLDRAGAMAPADLKVVRFTAELLQRAGRHHESIVHWRRIAFTGAQASADACAKLIGAIVAAVPVGKQPPLGELRVALKQLRRANDLNNEARLEAAWSLYRVIGLADEALALLEEALPCPADHVQVEPRIVTLSQWCKRSNLPLHILSNVGEPGRRPAVAELRNAVVHPGLGGSPLLDGGATAVAGYKGSSLHLYRGHSEDRPLLDRGVRAVLRVPKSPQRILEPCVYLGPVGRFETALFECFGSLAVLDAFHLPPDLPLAISGTPSPRVLDLIQLLGFAHRRLIVLGADQPTELDHFWIPSRPAQVGSWLDPSAARWLREQAAVSLARAEQRGARRVLLLDSASRLQFARPAEIEAALRPLGFETLDVSSLTLVQLASRLSQAEVVAGLYGEALAHVVFSPAGARILMFEEAAGQRGAWPQWYERVALACKHDVHVLRCPVAAQGTDSQDRSVTLLRPENSALVQAAAAVTASAERS